MFRPTRKTAEQLAFLQQSSPANLTNLDYLGAVEKASLLSGTPAGGGRSVPVFRPDSHSTYVADPRTPVDIGHVQIALGEEIRRTLTSLRLWQGTIKPDSKMRVMSKDRRFQPELASELCLRLRITDQAPQAASALEQLSEEFYRWVTSNPDESKADGLEAGSQGEIDLVCPPIKPVLPPLPK